MRGDKIYEYDLDVTGVTDSGVTLQGILSGQEGVPPQGVRMDRAALQAGWRGAYGASTKPGCEPTADLDIRAVIETENRSRIALSADGVAVPRAGEPIADPCENVSLSTAATDYAWVNTRQVWGVGTVNFAVGKVHIDAYMP